VGVADNQAEPTLWWRRLNATGMARDAVARLFVDLRSRGPGDWARGRIDAGSFRVQLNTPAGQTTGPERRRFSLLVDDRVSGRSVRYEAGDADFSHCGHFATPARPAGAQEPRSAGGPRSTPTSNRS